MTNQPALKSMCNFRCFLIKYVLVSIVLLLSVAVSAQTINYNIRLNQVGYYPNLDKKVYAAAVSGTAFSVQSLDHTTTFFTGVVNTSGIADFSLFTTSGDYVLFVQGVGYSAPFKINSEVFKDLSAASMKGYYYKRASTAITAEHGGVYARAAGHSDTQVMIHASAASFDRPEGTIVSSPKGWYDAGDYNCYVVNSNISTYTLLAAYEHFSSYYDTLHLNIPESGNGIPDILNEIKWNLDWMLTMQDPYDGAVYHKKTSANFSEFIMPDEDQSQRYMVGKSRGATYGFAAVMAVAYRVYLPYDPVYANQCLAASKKAYSTTAALYDSYTPDIQTGEYNSYSNEKAWASLELYISTKNDSYYVPQYYNNSGGIPMWQQQSTLGLMSFVRHRKNLTAIGFADTTASKNKLIAAASNTRSSSGNMLMYGGWGSNSFALNAGMMDMCAYLINKDRGYLNSAISILDYILGKNSSTYCFVTGYGSKKVMNPHDRISASDGVTEPIPGWVVGGPNNGDYSSNCTNSPTGYIDLTCSYTTNEVAINWNAPLVFLTGAIQSVNRNDLASVISVYNGSTAISSNQTPALSFGSSFVNTAAAEGISITIKNTGTKELVIKSITSTSGFNVSVLSSASPIAAGASSSFIVTATPMNLGVNAGTIEIQTNDKITPVFVLYVTVKGKPVNQPFLQVFNGTNPSPLNTSSTILVGESLKGTALSPITITLVNEGSSPLTIPSVTSTAGFEINTSALDETIEVGALSTFTITATPVNSGVNSGVITIQTNDPANQTFILNVTATGLVPLLSVKHGTTIYSNGDSYVFDPVIQGDLGNVVAFEITNSGTSPLTLEAPVLTGPFSFYMGAWTPAYLEPGGVIGFAVQFTPTTTGEGTGTLRFGSNADVTPVVILNLSGTGIDKPAHRMKVSRGGMVYTDDLARTVLFSSVRIGATGEEEVFTITNTGSDELSISDIVLTGPFELIQSFTATSIPAGNSITFSVVFKPITAIEVTGTATIVSNVPGAPFIFNFSGYGTAPPAPEIRVKQNLTVYASNGSVFAFPATVQGVTSNAVVFTITNTGNATLYTSGLTVTGPFELAQALTSTSVDAGGSITFSLVFKPVNATSVTGTVTIASNVIGSPFLLNLSGTVSIPSAPIMEINHGTTAYVSNGSAFVFPATLQGSTSSAESITIANIGNEALSISDITLTGPFELTQALTTTSVAAGSSTTFSVVFKPVNTGASTGTAIISSNETGSPFILNFSGTGTLATGTVGVLASDAISISPNPTKYDISIQLNGTYSNMLVNVYNALGVQVMSTSVGDVSNASVPLTLTNVASGMYIVEIITDQGNSMERVIKE